jgi:hypothetical protein
MCHFKLFNKKDRMLPPLSKKKILWRALAFCVCYAIFYECQQANKLHRRLCGKSAMVKDDNIGGIRTLLSISSLSCEMFYPNSEYYQEDYYHDDSIQEVDIFEKYPEKEHEPDYYTPHIEDTVAYAVTITACPEDVNDQPKAGYVDPGDSLYDSAAISKHSVCNNTVDEVQGSSIYGHTM